MLDVLPADLIDAGLITRTTLLMIIMLPIVGTVLGFTKHVIGLKSLGLYAPIVMTYSYFILGLSSGYDTWGDQVVYGLKVGLSLTAVVFITSALAHLVTRKIRLHYSPKMALVLTAVAMSMYLVIVVADYLEMKTFLDGSFVPIVLLSTVAEQFVSIMAKNSVKSASSLTLTTAVISFMTFMLIIYAPFQNLIIDYPYLLIVTILINFAIGRFTGLRVMEYIRFKDILNQED